ncbi:unnamed protein product [Meganyctiphanes norvegica]|uniref:Uncharacterized protein n=1 Tax=Meganyctiphanes norvegica TaxID=48144 RepID=A0AAV2QQ85_MEGNR
MSFAISSTEASRVSALVSRNLTDFEWQSDYDTRPRVCHISLWSRPIEGFSSSKVLDDIDEYAFEKVTGHKRDHTVGHGNMAYEGFSNIIEVGKDALNKNTPDLTSDRSGESTPTIGNPTLQHWALVFEWSDRTATYEASDVNSFLVPKWYDGKPRGKEWKKLYDLESQILSPMRVNLAAKMNRFNGLRYTVGHVNCQQWIETLCSVLSICLSTPTLAEAAPVTAIMASGGAFLQKNKGPLGLLAGVATGVVLVYKAVTNLATRYRSNTTEEAEEADERNCVV